MLEAKTDRPAFSEVWWRTERILYPEDRFGILTTLPTKGEPPRMVNVDYPHVQELFAEYACKGRSESASFLIWYLVNYYRLDPSEAIDAVCDQGGDRGVDGVFVNDNDSTITIFQSKISQNANSSVGDATLRTFGGCLAQFKTVEDIREIVTSNGKGQLAGLVQRLNLENKIQTHSIRGEFLSNIDLDANGESYLRTVSGITFVGKSDLVAGFISDERELPVSRPVVFDIFGFNVTDYTVDADTKAVIVPVKAKELVNLPGISDQSIFAYNVRGPLGKTQVNRDIVKSIKDSGKHKLFPLFHNGITIIANDLSYDTERLSVAGYYVVNGCQSLTALFDNKGHVTDDLRVLAKFIKLDPTSGEAEEITKFSNNQNGVKARDFKANNPIQIRLQNEFVAHYGGKFSYEIKRGEQLPDAEFVITNEAAGLLLMAFDLKEPWATHRRYEIFDEKFAALFGRPEVSADRIVFCKTIADAIEANLHRIENELCRRYVLTRHMLLYLVRLVLDGEAPEVIVNPASYARDEVARGAFRRAVDGLVTDLTVDMNYEVQDAGPDFDYRNRLRDVDWVKKTSQSILASRTKDVARGKAKSFEEALKGELP